MQAQKMMVGGVGIQVEDHGGAGAPVVLIHYGGANLRMWDPVIPLFQGTYRCIALDLRAHGRSDAPPTGYHTDDMSKDVAGVMDGLGIAQAHVVGSSIGAEVGLSLAAHYPEKVLSLVADGALCSEYGPYGIREAASLSNDAEAQQSLRKMAERPETTYESRDALVEKTRGLYEGSGMWNAWLEAVTAYGIVETEDGKFVSSWRKWARDEYMQNYFNLRVEDYYTRISCPVLMLPDENTKENEQEFDIVQRLSQLPKQCEIVVVPGSNHPFGWMLIPEAMANALLAFLKKVEAQ
ncbi:MAG: alpha/beta hydrolase [Candidatus Bipolaricaulia bacterium]